MTATHHSDTAVTDQTVTDQTVTDQTVKVTVRLDDIVELFELLSFCRALCLVAPGQINAAMAEYVINGYQADALRADLDAVSRRLYQAVP